MDIAAFIAGLPKVDLHCHIADAIPAPMLFDIAEANGIALSPHTPQTIYQATGFEDYLERLALVCSALASQEDFRKVLFEALRHGQGRVPTAGVRARTGHRMPRHQPAWA
jgi:adenosine deaminase